MNIQKLVSSQASYEKFIQRTLQTIKNQSDQENMLRNIVLFCKQVFSSNTNQRKKYLCLLLIRDIFQNANSEYFQKLVDEYLATKLYSIAQNFIENRNRQSRTGTQDKQSSQRIYRFAIETIVFWAKRLSFMPKSAFSNIYEQLRRMKIEFPQQFIYYKKQMLIKLWSKEEMREEQDQLGNPIIEQLHIKFRQCKEQLQQTINQSILNDEQVLVKPIIQKFREFLLYFFGNYKNLESEQTRQRDTIIVYFHIVNNLYRRICNRIYVSIQQIVSLTKQVFQTTYPPQYDSVDRMDIIELAGVFKYNALTIFQRIHQRIQKQDALIGSFKLSLNFQHSEPQKYGSLDGSRLGSNSITALTSSNNKFKNI